MKWKTQREKKTKISLNYYQNERRTKQKDFYFNIIFFPLSYLFFLSKRKLAIECSSKISNFEEFYQFSGDSM